MPKNTKIKNCPCDACNKNKSYDKSSDKSSDKSYDKSFSKKKFKSCCKPKDCTVDCSAFLRTFKGELKGADVQLDIAREHTKKALSLIGIDDSITCDKFDTKLIALANDVIRADVEIEHAKEQIKETRDHLNHILSNCTVLDSSSIPALLRLDELAEDADHKHDEIDRFLKQAYLDLCALQGCACEQTKLWTAVTKQVRSANDAISAFNLHTHLIRQAISCITGCILTKTETPL